jgi:hypothetical protein
MSTELPHASDYLKGLSESSALGNDSNNEQDNPYVGQGQAAPTATPQPSMGPRFQALADHAGLGGAARAMAPALSSATSAISPMIPAAAGAVAGASEGPSYNRFNSLLSQYRLQGKRDFSKDDAPANIDDMMARVAMRESVGDHKALNSHTKAGGLFQYLPETWGQHGGFSSATDAPPEMQYNRMLADLAGSLKRHGGDVPRALLEHYEGAGNTEKILKKPDLLYGVPGKYNGNETGYKRIASLIGEDRAAKWASDHQSKLGAAKANFENVYNVADATQG